jgi:choline-sulfatase
MADDRPNILVIMSDQHSPKAAGYAGDPVVRTPNLDRLAGRGVRFNNTYCPAPLCVPARMSFLTSRWPSDQQVWSNQCYLNSTVPTFAHHLTLAGYETMLCGRMHFEGYDQRHGFEKALVGDFTVQHPGTRHTFDWSRPGPLAKRLGNALGQSYVSASTAGPGRTCVQAYDEAVTQGAAEYLGGRRDDRPFCMVVGFYGPHCPFIAPKDLFEEYYARVQAPAIPEGYFDTLHPYLREWWRHRGVEGLTEQQVRRARAGYYGMVTFIDQRIGEILDSLEASSIARNTIVIYCSDHGEMAGEHGLWWKSNFYEGSARVPLLVSWAGHWAQGRTVDRVTNLVDIGPTLLEVAGAEPLSLSRGRSLLRFLSAEPGAMVEWLDETFSEDPGVFGQPPSRMIRSGDWKLCHYHGYPHPQLFNLADDPDEWNDLAEDPHSADIREALLRRVLDGWDGEAIIRELDQRRKDYKILSRWNQQVQPPTPDHWKPPTNVDVFEEPGE